MSAGHFVYAIGSGAERPIKVGISKDPTKRKVHLQNAQPHRLELLKVWELSYTGAIHVERMAHYILSPFALTGEWFNAPAETVTKTVDEIVHNTGGGVDCEFYRDVFRVASPSQEIGGSISGERRSDAAKAKAETIRAEWALPSADYPTLALLAKAGISRNTAKLYLGPRAEAQRIHQAKTKRIKNNRWRCLEAVHG